MIFIFGQRNLGKVDKVPHLFYVITQFFHINYLPLLPLRSYIVLAGSEEGNGFKGVQISISFKSILVGWLRCFLVLGMAVSLVMGLVFAMEEGHAGKHDLNTVLIPWLLFPVGLFLYWLTIKCTFASRERALQLAEHLGLESILVEKFLDARFQEELASNRSSAGENTES